MDVLGDSHAPGLPMRTVELFEECAADARKIGSLSSSAQLLTVCASAKDSAVLRTMLIDIPCSLHERSSPCWPCLQLQQEYE
jgi:hypothetical protein